MENNANKFEMTARTLFGLEEILAGELSAIGAEDIELLNRAVRFKGDKKTMYRANLELRTALRVYKPIDRFPARDDTELYRQAKIIDWSSYLGPQNTFAIDSTVYSDNFNHENYVALKVKDAIADHFRAEFGTRPDVNISSPDLRIHVHISGDECTISLDSSGNSLHKRGYRVGQTLAPVNEVLAAGMVLLSGWDADSDFVDPMCGSGTILMEAATYAYNIPPGIMIKNFGFMTWKDWEPELWHEVLENAKSRRKQFKYSIKGFDSSPKAITIAKYNIKNAELGWKILLKARKFERLTPDDIGGSGTVIINPPYGERLNDDDINQLYKRIGDSLKHNFDNYDAWIISANKEALKQLGLRTSKKLTLFNGALECKFHKYEIYTGSKKSKYLEPDK